MSWALFRLILSFILIPITMVTAFALKSPESLFEHWTNIASVVAAVISILLAIFEAKTYFGPNDIADENEAEDNLFSFQQWAPTLFVVLLALISLYAIYTYDQKTPIRKQDCYSECRLETATSYQDEKSTFEKNRN